LSGLAGAAMGGVLGYAISDVVSDSNFVNHASALVSGGLGYLALKYVGAKVGVSEFLRRHSE
jgi:hypothetical protein